MTLTAYHPIRCKGKEIGAAILSIQNDHSDASVAVLSLRWEDIEHG